MNALTLETVLRDQKEEFYNSLKKNFCTRKEEELIDLDSKLAQVVVGVRRSGKSTLCINVIKKSGLKFAYVNFDDERLFELKSEDLNLVLEKLYKIYGEFNHLFIDEVQNIEEWFLFVNRLLRTEMHILITGSNAKLLSGELATHLTGRYIKTELFPFSFSEYCEFKKVSKEHGTTKEKGLLSAEFEEYIKQGGFPELFSEKRKQTYINTLVDNILKEDIEKRYSIVYKAAFEKIANHLLNKAPSKINYLELKEEFGLRSDHTAENYVSYAKNAYLICGLHKFAFKSKIRIHNEKAYATDVSLMNNRDDSMSGNNLGWRLETIVYIELLRRFKPKGYDIYYYEEQSGEADFVICNETSVKLIIQVCYDISKEKTLRREINGLLLASKKTNCDNLLLITGYDEKQIIEKGKIINVLPAYTWLLESED